MAYLLDRFAPAVRSLIYFACAALTANLTACGDPEKAKRHASENACLKESIDRERAVKADLLRKRKEARDADRSTTQIMLSQRRAVEDFCIEQAQCFDPQSEKAKSNLIEWCIDEAEE
jgi:hypothetical protein